MRLVTYVRDAIRPGGTPSRYLIWVTVILLAQTLASLLPSEHFYNQEFNLAHGLGVFVLLTIVIANFAKSDKNKILAAYALYIVGLIVTTVTIASGITSLSGIVFMLTWAMTLFIAERREYISFDLVTLFMVLMLISTVILLMYNPTLKVNENWIILATGGVFTALDIYLVYTDFGHDKNFYQEYRKRYADLQVLSFKLSEILSTQDKIENLLWRVADECVPFLGLEECVIYLYDKDKGKLVQVSAFGGKSDSEHQIIDPIEIEPGKGFVGKTFVSGTYTLVNETRNEPDYIVDDAVRNAELSVPIFSNGKVVGVIDSEHSVKGFFLERHVQAFQVIASFVGVKIAEQEAKESILKANQLELEAQHYKELNELKSRFVTNISHDLKTPLSLIKGPAKQILDESSEPNVKKYAEYILKNTDHLSRVVGQLLQLNRVDQGLNELYLEEINLKNLVQKVAEQYKGISEKNEVTFTVKVDSINFLTDKFRFEQIIHNLVHNAFRYTPANGSIELSLAASKSGIQIVVSDTGVGIQKDKLAKVFDRFFKVDENNHEGTGIGLSLVQEYANSLSGMVELESEENKGAKFSVNLPYLKEEKLSTETSGIAEIGIEDFDGKPILFVIEDHADLNDFICTSFESEFNCIQAFDGKEAISKLETVTPDIIITDLMMPNINGEEFVKTVRSSDEFGHIPIIVLSAKSQLDNRIDLYDLGADNFLVKPFDVGELKAVVNNTLTQRKNLIKKFRNTYLTVSAASQEDVNEPELVQNELIRQAIELVKKEIDNGELNVAFMITALEVGRNKLQKVIKEETGLTPVEFIRSIRLNEAKILLQNESLSISQVAYSVGFNNLSYFTRSFKNEFGILPSDAVVSQKS